jgi:hypothetical protein
VRVHLAMRHVKMRMAEPRWIPRPARFGRGERARALPRPCARPTWGEMVDDRSVGRRHANLAQTYEHDAPEEWCLASDAPSYDIITEATAAAWEEALCILGGPPSDPLPLWTVLARRILMAAGDGERDPEMLKRTALRFLEG